MLILGILSGCGSAKRVDATDDENPENFDGRPEGFVERSRVQTIRGGYPDGDCIAPSKEDVIPGVSHQKQRKPIDKFKPIDGMSAAEIHVRAEELKIQAKKSAK